MAALRKVQTLHLRSVQQSLLHRGATLIEDGLRTASFPGTDGSRLLIVRCVSLGTICSGWSPMSVSLLIESRFRQLAASAIHAEEPEAKNASAVYFRDEVEPYLALAVRIALGKDTTAWFWRLAVSDWQPETPRKEALRTLLHSILRTAPGTVAVRQLVQTLLEAFALEALLSSLESEDGTTLLQAFGWSDSGFSGRRLQVPVHMMMVNAAPPIQILANACNRWGETDDRSLWLASMLLVMESPALHHSPDLLQHALALIHLARHTDVQENESVARAVEERLSGRQSENACSAPLRPSTLAIQEGEPYRSSIQVPKPDQLTERVAIENILALRKSVQQVTLRAGLFFLIPVMERTGFPEWLDYHPEIDGPSFAMQTLRCVAGRLKTPTSDPLWLVLGEIEEPAHEDFVQLWVARLRVYCRRVARISMHSLICRTGRITATPTHIDVQFLAGDADIRVRRTGLDIDPGWVPWFGRVVHFHYLSQGEFDA